MKATTHFLHSCLRCDDHCCTGDILVSARERRRILEKWEGEDPFGYDARHDYYYLDIDECPFLDGGKMCAVHDVRPTMCRLYPFSIVPLKGSTFRLHLDRSCAVAHAITGEEKEELREIAWRFIEELGWRRFLSFYES